MVLSDDFSAESCGELIDAFVYEAHRAVTFADKANCLLLPYASSRLDFFSKLPVRGKVQVIENLRIFNDICALVLAEGKSLGDSRALTWYAMRRLNLIFPSDLLDYIDSNNIIEVYDRNNVQIFRNFRFFEVSSYTLEDLLCRPWVELFQRKDTEQVGSILEILKKFYSKELSSVTAMDHLGTNCIMETGSPFALEVEAVINYGAPIYDRSRCPAGYIAIETATLPIMPVGTAAEELLMKYYFKRSFD